MWALKIKAIAFDVDLADAAGRETDGSAMITPDEPSYAPFRVDREYLKKHRPSVGGYWVKYDDGYESFSPAQAFIEGYNPIP